MNTFALTILLILAGQKPISLHLPMPDLKTCETEAHNFMVLNQPKDKPQVLFRASGCEEKTETPAGVDTKQTP